MSWLHKRIHKHEYTDAEPGYWGQNIVDITHTESANSAVCNTQKMKLKDKKENKKLFVSLCFV